MAGDERETKGWEPQDPAEYPGRGDGRGATTGPGGPAPGAGSYGGGRGTDYGDGEGPILPNGDLASARDGPPSSEETRTGWGGEGEHYPSADGPPNDKPPRNRPSGEGGA